jgi:hypothetical protein
VNTLTVEQSRKLLYVVAAFGLLFGLVLFGVHNHKYLDEIPSSDFAINRAAAQQMLDGQPLYDRAAARARVEAEAGDAAKEAFLGTYSSFIGPPSTALVYTPWAHVSYHAARATFRVVELLFMVGAIAIAGLAVPRRNRLLAWLVGLAALAIFFPVLSTLALGQVDGFVMLALAIALWASVRDRWYVVGGALGVAVLLKISPWIVLLFVILRAARHWKRVVVGVVIAGAVLVVASAVVGGRPHDFITWLNDVAPTLARGNRSVENQSLPALLGRLFTGANDIVETSTSLGALRYLGYAIGLLGAVGLWWWRRARPYVPLEFGVVILVALLSGPISWAHYLTWSIIPLMLLADPQRFAGTRRRAASLLVVLGGATALMALPVKYPTPAQVAAHWYYRPYSAAGTVAMFAYLGVALYFLAAEHPAGRPPDALSSEERAPVTA